jgi:hypothetical protein
MNTTLSWHDPIVAERVNALRKNITMIWLLTLKRQRRIAVLWGFGWWRAHVYDRLRAGLPTPPAKPNGMLKRDARTVIGSGLPGRELAVRFAGTKSS